MRMPRRRLTIALALAMSTSAPAAAEDRYKTDPTCERDARMVRADKVEKIDAEAKEQKRTPDELRAADQRVLMMCTHHVNYIMLSRADVPSSHAADYGYDPNPYEAKIQVSVKLPVFSGGVRDVFGEDASLWLAYSQTAWWQITEDSAPFRETNYEPEIFLEKQLPEGWGSRAHRWRIGASHQSNGQAGTLSRSWNRLRGELDLNRDGFTLRTRVWWRWPESAVDDDNPDIEEYLGYGDLTARWNVGGGLIAAKLVNAFGPGHHRGLQIDWMFHMGVEGEPAWMLQLYHGYGESLIDYDDEITRIGIALAVGDLL